VTDFTGVNSVHDNVGKVEASVGGWPVNRTSRHAWSCTCRKPGGGPLIKDQFVSSTVAFSVKSNEMDLGESAIMPLKKRKRQAAKKKQKRILAFAAAVGCMSIVSKRVHTSMG
jgi:hypothetical protein